MSATRCLRELLNNRGVYWIPSAWSRADETFFKVNDVGWLTTEMNAGKMKVTAEGYLTPEQVVDATLGAIVTGDTSDGFHTMAELYHHRAILFSVIVRDHQELAWKSKAHHDGTMYEGMFIVGIETPEGQATYHYDIDPYWDIFDCKELDRAPEWDGHTPDDAIARIATIEDGMCRFETVERFISHRLSRADTCECSECGYRCARGFIEDERFKYCPNCGRRIVSE